jgi:hypothetical protein
MGLTLTVESITRQSVIDSSYVGACDNCGKAIVNIATVVDPDGKKYDIGLDCKKTLIDKPILAKILESDDFFKDTKAKEYRVQSGHIEKFLKFCAYQDVDIDLSFGDQYLQIRDRLDNKQFPNQGYTGNTLYGENLGYLYKIGLKKFIAQMIESGKIKATLK